MTKIKLVKKLNSREVNTKYGMRTVTRWVVSEEGEELTKIASQWVNEATKNWAEGDVIYGDINRTGEYNGKDQYSIKTDNASPSKKEFQAKVSDTSDMAKENNAMLKEILSLLKGKEEPVGTDGDIPF